MTFVELYRAAPDPGPLPMWVIYDRPADYPTSYVARKWLIHAGRHAPTDEMLLDADLEALRAKMTGWGLTRLRPDPRDDPVIVESWI